MQIADDIGDNPTITTTDVAGNDNTIPGIFNLDDDAPSASACVFSPNPASTGTTVTATCTGVETNGSVTIPGMACGAEAGNQVICTGQAENIGDMPPITTADQAGNTTPSVGDFDLDDDAPSVVITAVTKLDNAAITDTTVQVTDASGVTAANVTVDGSTTATTSAFSCVQTSATQVDCTISIDASGDLVITADDDAGNTGTDTESGYLIETTPALITITAPTKLSNGAITDTTIQVTDANGIAAANVTVDGTSTATTSAFNCTQTSATQVDCTISVDSSGDLVIAATDDAGNATTAAENKTCRSRRPTTPPPSSSRSCGRRA